MKIVNANENLEELQKVEANGRTGTFYGRGF